MILQWFCNVFVEFYKGFGYISHSLLKIFKLSARSK